MMTVLERLWENLVPIGVYDGAASALSWELTTYASELEALYDELAVLYRERFVTTAEEEGLLAFEKLFGPDRTGESTERRRELLLLRMNLGNRDFTPAGIENALDSLGLQYVISEYPHIGKMTISATTTEYTPAEQAWIEREIGKIVPPHIDFQVTFNTLTWSQWDALNRTFAAADNADATWQQIDHRTD